jgi:hypothetical protein
MSVVPGMTTAAALATAAMPTVECLRLFTWPNERNAQCRRDHRDS